MRASQSLPQIRTQWIKRASERLAKGEGVRENFALQLRMFFDLLQEAVETGNPSLVDPLLNEWVGASTETELQTQQSSVQPMLGQLLQMTIEVGQENLDPVEALVLSATTLPVFTHAFEYVARKEVQLQVAHASHELEQARAMLERLDKSKSDFIAIAAHELKTPLTLIEGYATMLREMAHETSNPEQVKKMLDGMHNGAERLREIIDDMIDVSMIDNSLLSLNFQPVWINRIVLMIANELEEAIRDRQQVFQVIPFPGWDELIFGDPERLYQAFRNVISNAIKYTPDGGSITVGGRVLPGFLEFTVEDSGIGIDPEDQTRIFEKFGRLGNAALHSSGKTKFKGGGPGLGLAITKGIIDAHGGAIWVESEGYDEMKCPGTIFHILLPVRKESPEDKIYKLLVNPSASEEGKGGEDWWKDLHA